MGNDCAERLDGTTKSTLRKLIIEQPKNEPIVGTSVVCTEG